MQNGLAARTAARQFLDALLGDASAELLRPAIDWRNFRLMQLMQATTSVPPENREQLVARGLETLAAVTDAPIPEVEERALRSLRSLIEILLGRSWRFVEGYENPLLEGLRAGPILTTPPAMRRYLDELATLARMASAVTIAAREEEVGQKLMTMLFLDGRYCGFLPGTLPATALK
jgi:hypothetical protein